MYQFTAKFRFEITRIHEKIDIQVSKKMVRFPTLKNSFSFAAFLKINKII